MALFRIAEIFETILSLRQVVFRWNMFLGGYRKCKSSSIKYWIASLNTLPNNINFTIQFFSPPKIFFSCTYYE